VGGEFNAMGRGGQYVAVYPALRIVVVTTGNGTYGSGEITDRLGAALANPTGPADPNPEGVEALEALIAGLLDPPDAQPVEPAPAMAAESSGITYLFEPNPLELSSLRIDFNGGDEALLTLTFPDALTLVGAVGLDGVYRFTTYDHGFPLGLRGAWTANDTFTVEYDEIANRDAFLLDVQFAGDTVTLTAKERTRAAGVVIEGTANFG
jgi:hypothetical protein